MKKILFLIILIVMGNTFAENNQVQQNVPVKTVENEDMEIMIDYEKRETITLKELMPNWWGKERYAKAKEL